MKKTFLMLGAAVVMSMAASSCKAASEADADDDEDYSVEKIFGEMGEEVAIDTNQAIAATAAPAVKLQGEVKVDTVGYTTTASGLKYKKVKGNGKSTKTTIMAKDTLLVLSGGMDSVTMLWEYADTLAAAVTFQYGSNHNRREAECARWNCERLGIKWYEIDLSFMGKYFQSSLLSGADAIPEGNYDDENMRSTVVPFRNGIMLSVAAGLAESLGLKKVMIANHSGDHAIYPDCRPEFISSMGAAISDGTYEHLQLLAPYTNLSKGEIALRGKNLGVDYSHTYSCYKGGEHHCGKCGTCVERREALEFAGIVLDND